MTGNVTNRVDTIEKARQFVREHSDAELLSESWNGNKAKMRFRCRCGREFETDWNHFRGTEKRNRRQCTQCARNAMYGAKRMNLDELKARLEREGRSAYVTGEYQNQDSVLRFRCICGREFESSADRVLHGSGLCRSCGALLRVRDQRLTVSEIRSFAARYGCALLSGEYQDAKTPLLFRCRCGETFSASWNNFKSAGQRQCPHCNGRISKGERRVEQWLMEHGIAFEFQKRFADCRDLRELPFDFYLPEHRLCIEFDGEQHFRPVAFGRASSDYSETRSHDRRKNEWCRDHGVELLRIPYWKIAQIDGILCDRLIPR